MRFRLLSARETGIDFENTILDSDSLNILNFEYLYNGAGVGVGDFNNDGLQDIFFAGNAVSSRLYLNQGDFSFQDATKEAGVETDRWCTGVAVVDINQDGWDDIYVSTIHPDRRQASANLFFINKGNINGGVPVFEDMAVAMGLADSSYSTQAAFLDYDQDGKLDMYLVTNSLEDFSRHTPYGQRSDGTGRSVDRLYRNNGKDRNGVLRFSDVSKYAGILTEGWGLGVLVNDFNHDRYPDVYVTNDFLSNDHLYINNGDGTFTNRVSTYLKHQEYNGMGVDAADINNDGFNDIIAVDMMPNDNLRQKTMFSNIGYDRFWLYRQRGYQDQYVRNVLQLSNGNNTFSDIGYLSGVYCTDWSWSALFADFDNDGYRDLLITNGYPKDVTDLDFTTYRKGSAMFGTPEARVKSAMRDLKLLTGVKKPNFVFKNNGDLTFTNQADAWGLDAPSYTNGAAYADLDNDGDLDLVMNNINDKAFVYRNENRDSKGSAANFLRIRMKSVQGKSHALGTKVSIYVGGKLQYAEYQQHRGYKSTVEPFIHFGLGNHASVDSLIVVWPKGWKQVIKGIGANQLIELDERKATPVSERADEDSNAIFKEVHRELNVLHRHEEGTFIDFKSGQASLPHMHSKLGPGLAVGDVNGDGREDFVVGGAGGKSATIFLQEPSGSFRPQNLPAKKMEDMGVLLFDADGDGDLDLYCASGSSEFGREVKNYQHRLYRNNGRGTFDLDATALPKVSTSGGCIVANDFDHDGDLDLFVGGRVVPLKYPAPPDSYLLENDGRGQFLDVTSSKAGALRSAGMITSALWSDFDNDGFSDLIVVGEWMPVAIFRNIAGKKFERLVLENLTGTVGWWNSLVAGDFDNDGDIDYVAGNLGLNSLFQASASEPVSIYANDFDGNGSYDPIICRFVEGEEYPTHYRETMTEQMVFLRRSLLRYSLYGNSKLESFLPKDKLQNALVYKANFFRSAYIENLGNGAVEVKALPVEAQISPMYGIVVTDVDSDGALDLVTAGNSYSSETASGFYDAGIGLVLMGDGKGNFNALTVRQSGFMMDTDAKGMAELDLGGEDKLLIVTANSDSLKIFRSTRRNVSTIALERDDVYALISLNNGSIQKQEFYYGSGYLSQSSRTLTIPANAVEVHVFDVHGKRRKVL